MSLLLQETSEVAYVRSVDLVAYHILSPLGCTIYRDTKTAPCCAGLICPPIDSAKLEQCGFYLPPAALLQQYPAIPPSLPFFLFFIQSFILSPMKLSTPFITLALAIASVRATYFTGDVVNKVKVISDLDISNLEYGRYGDALQVTNTC